MISVFIFFGKDIGDILSSRDVFYVDEFILDCFADGVILELDVAYGTCGSILPPSYTCHIIVLDWNGIFDECFGNIEFSILRTHQSHISRLRLWYER